MARDDLRCFIAAGITPAIRRRLHREIGHLQLAGASVKWVPVDNMHLTLRFIGEVRPDEVIGICEVIEEACDGIPSCRLKIRGIETLPVGKTTPRVVVAGVEGETEPLRELFQRLQRGLAEIGFRPERKGLRLHVTLGRVRGRDRLETLLERIEAGPSRSFGELDVGAVHLMMSDLTPKGPEYSSMKSFRLA